jgi:hypothetical protein
VDTLIGTFGGTANAAFVGCALAALLNILIFHRAELSAAWQGEDVGARARAGPGSPYAKSGHGFVNGPGARAPPGASLPPGASPRYDEDDDTNLLDSERRDAIGRWCQSTFGGVADALTNLWRRLPDMPMQEHRTIAAAAMRPADGAQRAKR